MYKLCSVCLGQVLMKRIATLTDPNAGQWHGKQIDSEWLLAHHLKENNIKVRLGVHLSLFRVFQRGVNRFPVVFLRRLCRPFRVSIGYVQASCREAWGDSPGIDTARSRACSAHWRSNLQIDAVYAENTWNVPS